MQEAYGRADSAPERAADPADRPREPGAAPTVMDPANLTERSHPNDICPFFRSDRAGLLEPPFEMPDEANRCIAVGGPQPQSARQQELVCLTAGHFNCHLFLQGVVNRRKAVVRLPAKRGLSTPVALSALALVAAAALSVAFLLVRGGLTMPVASVVPSGVAVISPAPASQVAVALPDPTPTEAIPTASPTPSPSPSPTASPSPAPTPPPTPAPTPARTPPRTSDRYALLEPCPGRNNCWIYTVRSGDNLRSIANYFGVSYPTVLDMNPQITDPTTIRAGDEIRMPPPTR